MGRFFALAIALCLAGLAACHHSAPDLQTQLRSNLRAPENSAPVLLAAYQPWFGRPNHIDVGYSSQDRGVLLRQIDEAKKLGIYAFVVNWYGPRHEYEDHSYFLLQQAAADENFHTALLYDEDVNDSGPSTDKVIVDLQYAYDRYIGPHAVQSRSAYLGYQGKPLVFLFPKGGDTDWHRVREVVRSWEDPPLLIFKDINRKLAPDFDGFYAWVQPGGGGWAADGSHWGRDYLNDFYRQMSSEYPDKLAVGAAWPGFDDSRAGWTRNRHISARCGKTMEESLRLFRRYFDPEHPLPFLMINTWNDYEEGTAIERGLPNCSSEKSNGG